MKSKSVISTMFNLQLFADGGVSAGAPVGNGSDGGASTGSGDPLNALGIPAKAKHIVDKMPKNTKASTLTNTQQNKNDITTPSSETERKAFKDIIDEYGDEAKDYINKAFSKRLSKYKGIEAENAKMKEILDLQNMRYGLDTGSKTYLDDYMSAVQNDTKIFEDKAMEAGMTVDEFVKVKRAEQIINENNRREQMRKQDEFTQAHVRSLIQQAEKLQSEFPNFNLENEISNPQFKSLLTHPNSAERD